MKKRVEFYIICLLVGILSGIFVDISNYDKPDFEIFQSFISSSPNCRETDLKVIVNRDSYDLSELFLEIREFHTKMNGTSNKLTIELFNSKDDLLNGNVIAETVFCTE